mmetsp:Transcript_27160/g.66052  ORF Transcript_27160/g.66052 Transcript_27160/m.66052 type:complete len:399 (+) Transcript_27160:104-1300(+)
MVSIPLEALARGEIDSIRCFVDDIKQNGYSVVELPEKVAQSVLRTQKAMLDYFLSKRLEEKMKHNLDHNSFRYGYWNSPHMGKELFQVRLSDQKALWPSQKLREQCDACFQAMHSCGEICLMAIGMFLCADDMEPGRKIKSVDLRAGQAEEWFHFWDKLCKDSTTTDFPLSATLLDCFRYHSPSGTRIDSCGAHTDYNLLTLVPRALGKHGLEIFNWDAGEWDRVEESLTSASQCVVMPGESLPLVTAGYFLASIHRVIVPKTSKNVKIVTGDSKLEEGDEVLTALSSKKMFSAVSKERISTPFLLFANPRQKLCPCPFRNEIVQEEGLKKWNTSDSPPTSDAFVRKLLGEHESVTFGNKYRDFLLQSTAEKKKNGKGDQTSMKHEQKVLVELSEGQT